VIRTQEPPEDFLAHYGILRKSGRYPWGSGQAGETQSQRNRSFLDYIDGLKKQGLSDSQIAKDIGITRRELNSARRDASQQQRQEMIYDIERLAEKGMSNSAIGRQLGINESSVRNLRAPGSADKANKLQVTTNMLKSQVDEKGMIDVGVGVEHHVGVTKDGLANAVQSLKDQGYGVHSIYIPQVNIPDKFTNMKVLTKPGITKDYVNRNRKDIRQITEYSEDHGRTFKDRVGGPPISVSQRRIKVNYGEDGGAALDGVIYVRPGVKDLAIGNKNYGQVRIMVDNTHYLKGMAVYKEDLPDGVDIVFNTKKSDTGRKKDAMKELADDPEFPFGAIVTQMTDSKGKVTSAMNLVNEEGSWDRWARTLSSQMLSKQDPKLAQAQLNQTYSDRLKELTEIQSLTNPTVKRELLLKFAETTDSAAVHLKAANLPRQSTKVILPINSIKRDEVYAPSFRDGERVVLVRFPHGGTFEIPELTVNNRNQEAKRILGKQAADAIGIHHTVAQHLSGADFDGDTVLVIPNNNKAVKHDPALEGLKSFDPMMYKIPKDSPTPRMTAGRKQSEMGKISNLITDMTLRGANNEEKAAAVRHSMVVIDAVNHELDFRKSEKDNGIKNLKQKYQLRIDEEGKTRTGARTLISQRKARTDVPRRRDRPARLGGPIDPETGKRMYEYTGAKYKELKIVTDPVTGKKRRVETGRLLDKTTRVERLAAVDDARRLSSGTEMEEIYATHSNKLKAMANGARKEALTIKDSPAVPSSKTVYSNEVVSLNSKLNNALRNAPLERQAQLLANARVAQKRQANPNMEKEELKKIKNQSLTQARNSTGAGKERITITQSEWNAIQAGAISPTKLQKILANADVDNIKYLALPKDAPKMTSSKIIRARQMIANGFTQAEIADQLGVGLTTLKVSLNE
jgi:hypothetical protein